MIGYGWNDGGLNNQKLALLGLMIEASHSRLTAYLPKIYSKDSIDTRSGLFEFADVFWIEQFLAFAERWNIVIVPAPESITYADRIERGGWNYFHSGAWHIANLRLIGLDAKSITADFCRSLRPKIANSRLFQSISNEIFNIKSISKVVQARYEEYWRIYSQYNLDPILNKKDDYCISPMDIVKKLYNTTGNKDESIYISCDERHMPYGKDYMRNQIILETGIKTFWKSDFIDESTFNAMTALDASLIDFEIARTAEFFCWS